MPYSRYAVYIAPPPDSDLWRFGCGVIGRDAMTGLSCEGFAPEGHESEAWRRLTSEPRRYGFHATMKAPFDLRADLDIADLMDHVAAFARTIAPFDIGELGIGAVKMNGRAFAALTPTDGAPELRALEQRAVRSLDKLRAPLTEAERRRRESASLSPRQRYYLEAWGYPYVLDEFRPHFTLTNAVADSGRITRALEWEFKLRVASGSLRVDALTLFGEPRPGADFKILRRFPLASPNRARRRAPRAASSFIG